MSNTQLIYVRYTLFPFTEKNEGNWSSNTILNAPIWRMQQLGLQEINEWLKCLTMLCSRQR